MKSSVYIIGPVEECYKVGRSDKPERRLSGFQFPVELSVSHVIKTDDSDWLERYFHQAFSHVKTRREWFRLCEQYIAILRGITEVKSELCLPDLIRELHRQNEPIPIIPEAEIVPPHNGVGRPRKPPAERVRLISTTVSPAAHAHCVAVGGGSPSRGLRIIVEAAAAAK